MSKRYAAMGRTGFWAVLLAAGLFVQIAQSAPLSTQIVIEPDRYAERYVLNTISPHVTLSTAAFDDDRPTFDVVSRMDSNDSSTGVKVFAHGPGVRFWNDNRKFRMDFHTKVTSVSIDYIASGFFDEPYVGRLEAYSHSGVLLDSYITSPLAEGQFETMTVSAPRIAYALAFPPDDPFGDLDHLRFTIPEPGGLAMCGLGALGLAWFRRRRRPTPRFDRSVHLD